MSYIRIHSRFPRLLLVALLIVGNCCLLMTTAHAAHGSGDAAMHATHDGMPMTAFVAPERTVCCDGPEAVTQARVMSLDPVWIPVATVAMLSVDHTDLRRYAVGSSPPGGGSASRSLLQIYLI